MFAWKKRADETCGLKGVSVRGLVLNKCGWKRSQRTFRAWLGFLAPSSLLLFRLTFGSSFWKCCQCHGRIIVTGAWSRIQSGISLAWKELV